MNEPTSPIIDLEHTSACLYAAVRRTARTLTSAYDAALAASGLTGTQFTLLTRLATTGPVAIKTLAAAIGIDRTTLSRTLKPLSARGLIQERTGEDRRVKRISITTKGTATKTKAEAAWRDVQAATVAALGEGQAIETLARLTALEGAAIAAAKVTRSRGRKYQRS